MTQGIESRISTKTGITFTVSVPATEVALNLAGTPPLSSNPVIVNFAEGENIIIKGFCLSLPYQFGQGMMDDVLFFQLGWSDNTTHSGSVNEVGDTGYMIVPDPNVWYDMDVFVPWESLTDADSKWKLEIVGLGGWVSMLNAPAVLNLDVLQAQIHFRVNHTLPMLG